MERRLRRTGFLTAILLSVAVAVPARAQRSPERSSERTPEAEREAAYAVSIAHVADSAIRRLDFFPARLQVRVQMLFVAPRDSTALLFHEIGQRSLAAAQSVDEIASRFEQTRVPEDLGALHKTLLSSLRDARTALDHLAASANACQIDPSSVTRCQSPFTSASSAVASSYKRYLDARSKIREQILDTQTVLPEFVVVAMRSRP